MFKATHKGLRSRGPALGLSAEDARHSWRWDSPVSLVRMAVGLLRAGDTGLIRKPPANKDFLDESERFPVALSGGKNKMTLSDLCDNPCTARTVYVSLPGFHIAPPWRP